jgi:NADPH-dependent curcumin reductase CurA
VLVSGAAGAVGGLVGQIAKLKGCRAIGIAGGEEKCRHVVEDLGFDAAIDYKGQYVPKALRDLCPAGIDVYFDNVGGTILDAALARLRRHARVVICGAISQYNATETPRGPASYMSLLVNRASMAGFVVFDYQDRVDEFTRDMSGWLAGGQITNVEHVVSGDVRAFPATLLELFRGANTGKLVLALEPH